MSLRFYFSSRCGFGRGPRDAKRGRTKDEDRGALRRARANALGAGAEPKTVSSGNQAREPWGGEPMHLADALIVLLALGILIWLRIDGQRDRAAP